MESETKCKGKDGNLNPCDELIVEGTKVCEKHQYMKDYTDEEIKESKPCSTCHMPFFCKNGSKTCPKCKARAAENRKKAKENKIRCKHIKDNGSQCINQANKKYNGYCGKDKKWYFKEETEKEGKRVCSQFKDRGCPYKLDSNYKYQRCPKCRENDCGSNKDNSMDDLESDKKIVYENKHCSGCRKICQIETDYNVCKKCRDKTQIRNDISKAERATLPKCIFPGCINSKKYGEFCGRCKMFNDPDKFKYVAKDDNFKICSHCEHKMIPDSFISDGYEYKCCILCRENMRVADLKREPRSLRYNINDTIYEIHRSAIRRDIKIDINGGDIKKQLSCMCQYCDQDPSNIDRVNNDHAIGYVTFNIVPACMMCNFMKSKYTVDDFLKYCLNIYNNIGSFVKNDNSTTHHNKYKTFVSENNRRKHIKVLMTETEYEAKFKHKCFYCAGHNKNDLLGLDRIDSLGNYTVENSVSACIICNRMKFDYEIIPFFDHIKKILVHNKLIDNTDKEFKINAPKNENTTPTYIISELLKIMDQYHIKYDKDHVKDNKDKDQDQVQDKAYDYRNVKKFLHDEKYYAEKIFNTYDIDKFEPELEFCENDEQRDIWKYYRLRISSHHFSQSKGRLITILIRDKSTKKYVGIASLSSDLLYNTMIDQFIGWSYEDKINNKKTTNIMNISTCIGIPPFSFNYNGGKLITKLMFSQEVYNYVLQKYGDKLAGLSTLSLYGKSIQYDRLKELKFLGLTIGHGSSHIDDTKLLKIISKYMDQNDICKGKKFRSRMQRIKCLCNHLGIRDMTFHGTQRGVYFGYLGRKGKDFLNSKTDEFVPDNIKPVKEIFEDWKKRWAEKRFNNLITQKNNNKLMINYSFQNYTNNKEYNKWRVYKYLKSKKTNENDNKDKKYTILSEDDKRTILKIWYENKKKGTFKSFTQLSEIVEKEFKKIDRKVITRIIGV